MGVWQVAEMIQMHGKRIERMELEAEIRNREKKKSEELVEKMRENHLEIAKKLAISESKVLSLSAENDRFRTKITQEKREIAKKLEEITQQKREIEKKLHEIIQQKREIEKKLVISESKIHSLSSEKSHFESRIVKEKQEVAKLISASKEHFDSHIQSISEEIHSVYCMNLDLKHRNFHVMDDNERLQKLIQSMKFEIGRLKKTHESCVKEIEREWLERLNNAQEENLHLKKTLNYREKEEKRLKDLLHSSEETVSKCNNLLEDKEKYMKNERSEKEELTRKLSAMTRKMETLKESCESMKSNLEKAVKTAEQCQKGKSNLDRQLIQAKKELGTKEKEFVVRIRTLEGLVTHWQGRADFSCSICLENPRSSCLQPCRHVCVCDDCSRDLTECPICRAHIDFKEKVYFS